MLYNNIIFFLGLYSWNIKKENLLDNIVSKKNINFTPIKPIKNTKKFLHIIEPMSTNTPNMNFYIDFTENLENINKKYVYLYNLYSFFIFLYLCTQPSYLIYFMILDSKNIEQYSIRLLLSINTPIHYLWAKSYFKTNHFDMFNNTCNILCNYKQTFIYIIILSVLVITNIIINLLFIDTFYNKYNWIHLIENKYYGCILIIIEWIYSRFIYLLSTLTYAVVFCKHIKDMNKFIQDISKCNYDLEDTYCLSNFISKIANLRHSVEISIEFFNNIFSFLTITQGISLGIFVRLKYDNYIIYVHDYYLIQFYALLIICQIIFFYNVIYYSIKRNALLKFIQSSSFINRYLTRWSTSKMKKKCKDNSDISYYSKVTLCIEEENATTLDWIILDKLLSTKWMDFSIMGISTQDGALIKKVITFSSLAIILLEYI